MNSRVPSFGAVSIDYQSIIEWPEMHLGTPVKNGITVGGWATCS